MKASDAYKLRHINEAIAEGNTVFIVLYGSKEPAKIKHATFSSGCITGVTAEGWGFTCALEDIVGVVSHPTKRILRVISNTHEGGSDDEG